MKPELVVRTASQRVVVLVPEDGGEVIVVGPGGYDQIPELEKRYRYVEMWVDE